MKIPRPLIITQQDRMECWENADGYRGVFAHIDADLADDELLAIKEWCEEARAWLKERRDNGKAAPVVTDDSSAGREEEAKND